MSDEKDQTPVDEESQKLLDDLAEQDKKPTPEKKAAAKKKTSTKKKAAPAVKKTESTPTPEVVETPDDTTVTNISKNPRRIGGTTVPVGGSYTLTEQDLENEILCKKVDHAIALGLFSHGAD